MNSRVERLRSPAAAFAYDLNMISVAWLLTYWLRFNYEGAMRRAFGKLLPEWQQAPSVAREAARG